MTAHNTESNYNYECMLLLLTPIIILIIINQYSKVLRIARNTAAAANTNNNRPKGRVQFSKLPYYKSSYKTKTCLS